MRAEGSIDGNTHQAVSGDLVKIVEETGKTDPESKEKVTAKAEKLEVDSATKDIIKRTGKENVADSLNESWSQSYQNQVDKAKEAEQSKSTELDASDHGIKRQNSTEVVTDNAKKTPKIQKGLESDNLQKTTLDKTTTKTGPSATPATEQTQQTGVSRLS